MSGKDEKGEWIKFNVPAVFGGGGGSTEHIVLFINVTNSRTKLTKKNLNKYI